VQEPVQWGGGWWRQADDGTWWYWNAVAFQWEQHRTSPPQLSGPRAGFWKRFGASFVDGLLLGAAMFAICWPLVGDELSTAFRTNDPFVINAAIEDAGPLFNFVGFVIPFGYRVWLEGGARGQTWGKRLFGIRVIKLKTGAPIGHGQAALRVVCSWVSGFALGIGYLAMLWDPQKQTWHDKWTDSVVVPTSAFPVR
jgi:uncharacterized RDD family membrane protein YckC